MYTSRCNSALFLALITVKKSGYRLAIADQGGWLTYKQYANLLDIPLEIVETKNGSLPVDRQYEVVLCAEPAGYVVGQDLEGLRKASEFLILDICGSVGRRYLSEFQESTPADILCCSFSRWKPLSIGYGGFIGCKDKTVWEDIKSNNSLFRVEEAIITEKLPLVLKKLPESYASWDSQVQQVKQDFPEAIADQGKAICAIIPFDSEEEKTRILQYAQQKGYETTECPREIRLNRKAISIEIKRIFPE